LIIAIALGLKLAMLKRGKPSIFLVGFDAGKLTIHNFCELLGIDKKDLRVEKGQISLSSKKQQEKGKRVGDFSTFQK